MLRETRQHSVGKKNPLCSWFVGVLVWFLTVVTVHGQDNGYYPVQELVATGTTVVGETIQYPRSGKPKITVALISVLPGAKAAFHRHPVPLVAYILEGELTVDYGPKGIRLFRKGEAFIEAMDVPHRGMNQGKTVAQLLAVYIGAEGVVDVVLEK